MIFFFSGEVSLVVLVVFVDEIITGLCSFDDIVLVLIFAVKSMKWSLHFSPVCERLTS